MSSHAGGAIEPTGDLTLSSKIRRKNREANSGYSNDQMPSNGTCDPNGHQSGSRKLSMQCGILRAHCARLPPLAFQIKLREIFLNEIRVIRARLGVRIRSSDVIAWQTPFQIDARKQGAGQRTNEGSSNPKIEFSDSILS